MVEELCLLYYIISKTEFLWIRFENMIAFTKYRCLILLMFLYKIIEEKSHLTSEKSNFELCPEATIHHFRFPLILNVCNTMNRIYMPYWLCSSPKTKQKSTVSFFFIFDQKEQDERVTMLFEDTGCIILNA